MPDGPVQFAEAGSGLLEPPVEGPRMNAHLAGEFLKRTALPTKQVDQLLVDLRNEIVAAEVLHKLDVLPK